MHDADDGTQISRELLDAADPTPYIELKRLALARSVPFSEFAAN